MIAGQMRPDCITFTRGAQLDARGQHTKPAGGILSVVAQATINVDTSTDAVHPWGRTEDIVAIHSA